MHPAFSVIFLTTLIGVGQGLFLALYTVQLYALAGLLPVQGGSNFYAEGSAVALAFLGAGLFASFFHLGHPQRGWRAVACWRTSWLSREVIVLPAFIGSVLLYGAIHFLNWHPVLFTLGRANVPVDPSTLVGVVATALAFLLFLCTGMIYASVRFLQEWHHWLTVANFVLFGGASGFTAAAVYAALRGAPNLVGFYASWAIILTGVAAISRMAALIRNHHIKPRSTLSSAIGVRHNRIVQRTQGFMGGSFNTREFFHGADSRKVALARIFFLVLAFPFPILLLAAALTLADPWLVVWAFSLQYSGLLIERWYFFAEARHPQNLYYQSVA